MRTSLRLLLLAGFMLTARAAPGQAVASPGPAATLATGDVLRITVWRRPEFSGDFVIAPDGTITHPLYRSIRVGGVPMPEVESRIRAFLVRFEADPAFVLSPLLRVVVGGEVRQPNVYSVVPGTTLAQVLAMAGGPTERGRLDQVTVIRDLAPQMVDLTRPSLGTMNLEVRSGDQVVVARGTSFFRDVAAPAGSIIAALAAVTSVFVQLSR